MSKPSKRSALGALDKTKVIELDRGFEIGTARSEPKDAFVDALARSKRASFERVLHALGKAELRVICSAHGLPTRGKKDALVERILGREESDQASTAKRRRKRRAVPADPAPQTPGPSLRETQTVSGVVVRRTISPMNIEDIEENVRSVMENPVEDRFVYDLLLAFGLPKASITRLKKGDYNLSKKPGEVLWKKRLCFRHERDSDLHACIDELRNAPSVAKQEPRFILVTDYQTLLSVDTKTGDTLDIPFAELPKHFDFFLPWAGLEKSQLQSENPADVKAAERMGRLYDLILQDNPPKTAEDRHALNVFLSRLLFCFFAEDTDIFASDQFTKAVASHTAEDGRNLQGYLQKLFKVLNIEERSTYPKFLQAFPYVNGGLFADDHPVPRFNAQSRKIILECGALDWKAINPDIFGFMIQAVMHDDLRGSLGLHYTSVVNIRKVIDPLFLSDLQVALERAGNNKKRLTVLLDRLYGIRIFDPACGSGNFLIIAYKELCRLEVEIFRRLHGDQTTFKFESKLKLTQFYGIEIDDFAHETAKLSLWLAEHQMNLAFKEVFGTTRPTLPLKDGGQVVCANAAEVDWGRVCPKDEGAQIYLIGNPPYVGARNQSREQKADLERVFEGHADYKDSDYVCAWYLKAAQYIRGTSGEFAFVSTNSICQGEQVGCLWPRLLEYAEIAFAHRSFKWTNNAKRNAGVTCVILGIRGRNDKSKVIFSGETSRVVTNISPYLFDGKDTIVFAAEKPLSRVPKMVMGNMPRDGGNLIMSKQEAQELVAQFPDAATLLRDFVGTQDFLRSTPRACLWISDEDLELANSIPIIRERIDAVRKFRLASKAKTTRQYGLTPHKFAQRCHVEGTAIFVPSTSSERRDYVPNGFLDASTVISNLAYVVYESAPAIFAVISSRMHMTWLRTVAGRLETRYRYSASLCYNPFPFPNLTPSQKEKLEERTFGLLDERERHSEKTLEQLYDPELMPDGLRLAHQDLDLAVDRCYRKRPFASEEERVLFLFAEYERLATTGLCLKSCF